MIRALCLIILIKVCCAADNAYSLDSSSELFSGVWQAELDPQIQLSPPVCNDKSDVKNRAYRLCLPRSQIKDLKVTIANNSAVIKGYGTISGPVLLKTTPPALVIGAMKINKGSVSLGFSKSGGTEIKALDGKFEIEGLIMLLNANKALKLERIVLEFTSPDDALAELSASGQNTGVVLRVERTGQNKFKFIPSVPSITIFPKNLFFDEFEGRITGNGASAALVLQFPQGREIKLKKKNAEEEF